MGNYSEDKDKKNGDAKKSTEKEDSTKYGSDDENTQKYRLDYYCQLCDAHMNSSQMWENHVQGKRHKKNVVHAEAGETISKPKSSKKKASNEPAKLLKVLDKETEPIVGLDFITELQKTDGDFTYSCVICHSTCSLTQIVSHLTGAKHRLHYLKSVDKDGYELIMNMKMKKSGLTVLAEEKAAELEQEYGRGVPSVEIENEPLHQTLKSRDSDYSDRESYSYKRSREYDDFDRDRDRDDYPYKKPSYERSEDPWSSSSYTGGMRNQPFQQQITPITYPLTNLRNMSTPGKLEILEQLSSCGITSEQESQTVTKIIKSLTQCLLQYKIRNLPPNVQDLLTKTLIGGDIHELENVLGLTSAECSSLSSILGGTSFGSAGKMGSSGGNLFGMNQRKDMFGRAPSMGAGTYNRESAYPGTGNEMRRDYTARNVGPSGERMGGGSSWGGNQMNMGGGGLGMGSANRVGGGVGIGSANRIGGGVGGGGGGGGGQGRSGDIGMGGFNYGGVQGKSFSENSQWSSGNRNLGYNNMQPGMSGWGGSYMGNFTSDKF